MKSGWIKLYNQMVDWEWYKDPPAKILFLHCLLKANLKPNTKYKGQKLEIGEFATTAKDLAEETGLTDQQLRTALKKLESTGEITKKSTNKNTFIKVENWGFYQGKDEASNKRATNEQQTNNKRTTNEQQTNRVRIKEYNNNNIYIMPLLGVAENVKLSEEELEKLKELVPYDWQEWIDRLSEYMASKGKRYKSHYMTLRTWIRREQGESTGKQGTRFANVKGVEL